MARGEDSDGAAGWVAGADACSAGWVVVLRHEETGTTRCRRVDGVAALFALPEAPAVLGVDMVIGLPTAAQSGGRACDRAARQLLGWPRSSSVFSPPARTALEATTYAEAQALNRASSSDAVGLTKQAFNLFPKMRALDEALRQAPADGPVVYEVHPECSFCALNGGTALAESKHTADGRARRRVLLERAGFAAVGEAMAMPRGIRGLNVDDVLDAHAVCWTAGRIRAGMAQRLPASDPVPVDGTGLPMAIWR
jgi:predicted RNase H-like nuclease